MANLDTIAQRLTRAGDAAELLGPPNRFGGRPIVARIERRQGGYAVGPPDRVRAQLADAVADLPADHAASEEWAFAN